jgi:phosphate-selective porin OprO and OprP
MEQQRRPCARYSAAFILWLMAFVAPRAFGQIAAGRMAGEEQAPILAPTSPPSAESLIDAEARADMRLDQLEGQLQKLLEAEEKQQAKAAGRPSFRMGGQIQVDYLYIGQSSANRASVGTAEDVFDFRRARLTASGQAFEVVEYATGFDFALAGRPSFMDNFIEVTSLPILGRVRVGHYFEPFSLERFTVNRNNTFAERSLADTFAPARNLGIMAHDTIGEEQRGTWAMGWFRSNSDNFGDDFSNGGGQALTGRLTRVMFFDEQDGRSFLHLGAAYSYRSADERQVAFASFPEARTGTGEAGIPPFVETGTISAQND